MELDKSSIASAQGCWNKLSDSQKHEYIVILYRLLFNQFPEYKHLFSKDLERVRDDMSDTTEFLIKYLDNPQQLHSAFTRLAKTHSQLGISKEMYENMTACKRQALQAICADKISTKEKANWEKVMRFFSDSILQQYPD